MTRRVGMGFGDLVLPGEVSSPLESDLPVASMGVSPGGMSPQIVTPGTFAFGPGPNEPAGMKSVLDWDGSSKRFSKYQKSDPYDLYGAQWGDPDNDTEPIDTGYNNNNKTTIIDDPSNPCGSGKSLRQLYPYEQIDTGVIVADANNEVNEDRQSGVIPQFKTTLPGGAGAYTVGGNRSNYIRVNSGQFDGHWAEITAWDEVNQVVEFTYQGPDDSEKSFSSVPADGTDIEVFQGHEQGRSGGVFWNDWRNWAPSSTFYPEWDGSTTIGAPSEVYMQGLLLFENSWVNAHPVGGGKHWYFNDFDGGGGSGVNDMYVWGGPDNIVSKFRNQGGNGFHGNGSGSGVFNRKGSGGFSSGLDAWHRVEVWWKAQSAASNFDGQARVWVNNDLCTEWGFTGDDSFSNEQLDNLQWTDLSDDDTLLKAAIGFEFGHFWGGAWGYPCRQDQYMRWGGFHVSVKP